MIEISTTATFDRLFKFVGPNQAELRYVGHHHSIYEYEYDLLSQ